MFQMFHLFQTYVANVSFGMLQCKCFGCFHTYVANILSGCLQWLHTCFQDFSDVFVSVSNVCCKCFSYFGHMLQAFHLDVAKYIRILLMLQWDSSAAAACCSYWGVDGLHVRSSNTGDVRAMWAPYGLEKRGAGIGFRTRASVRTSRL
jgi:hypothetical protein